MEKKINKWKIAFWCYFAVSIVVVGYLTINIFDQAYSIAYNGDAWAWEREDKDNLQIIFNNTDFSKSQIIKELKVENYQIEKDTISLNTIKLVFENEKLFEIKKYQ